MIRSTLFTAALCFHGAVAAVEPTPAITVTPTTLHFGAVGFGESGTPQSAFLTNHSEFTIGVDGIVVPDGFLASDDCGVSLAPQQSCEIAFNFHPVTAMEYSANAAVTTTEGQIGVTLRGDNPRSDAWLTVGALDFDRVTVGATGAVQTARVVNGGRTAMSFALDPPSGPFAADHTCGEEIPAGSFCEVSFTFSPTQAGSFEAYAFVQSNASWGVGPTAFTLRGAGETTPSSAPQRQWVTPTVLDFGLFPAGQASPVRQVRLTNTGSEPVTGFEASNVSLPLVLSHDCGGSIAPGGSCMLQLHFAATTPRNVSRNVDFQTSAGTFQIELFGISIRPQVHWTPMAVDFGPVDVGAVSSPQSITVSNVGDNPLQFFDPPEIAPPFLLEHDCPEVLAAHTSCTYTLRFAPQSSGLAGEMVGTPTDANLITVDTIGFGEPLFWDGFGD